ncbi:MAG: IS630 family transposase, partial [Methylobacterium sp.]|nr:IS630 family transposase [Methylobacterium sp.]
TRRDRSGQERARRGALAQGGPQARHRGGVRRRLSRALGRQAAEAARLLPHECAAPASDAGWRDHRGFQKNFRRTLAAHLQGVTRKKKIEIWFQDEARIGQKNGLVRQWARRGTRPRQPADQRYESAYLFGAICPARGVGAALALPFADTEAMQLHIDEIALHVARNAHAVLLLDRAGWHTTGNLAWPKNVTPILLPSRSPELNPVEQVWRFCAPTTSQTAFSRPTTTSSTRLATRGET